MEGITSLQADFDAEVKRRNIVIRNLSQQNDNLSKEISDKQKLSGSLDIDIENKKKELDDIDIIFDGKMADFQKHVDTVSKVLKEKEDVLTQQKSDQEKKESEHIAKDLEITGKLNNIEAIKERTAKSLLDMLNEFSVSIHDVIQDIKGI